ncbi:MAG: FAD/NAD(P)-binding protein [Elusimicrobia bacterium]|nr:FAD/NAD(P)-binding protein [Elusimicrobiota bacterium]
MATGSQPPEAHPLAPASYRVRARRRETRDTVTLELRAPGGAAAPSWRPGQFNMLGLPGVGEVPISISGGSQDGRLLQHTIRAVGPVTSALAGLRPGGRVGLRGPFGSAWPLEQAAGRDLLVLAGGLGLVPLRPVLRAVAARRRLYGRVSLLYGARAPQDILFRGELAAWRRAGVAVEVAVDRAQPSWRGRVGVVTDLLAGVAPEPGRTDAWICGPEIMMRFSVRELQRLGLDRGGMRLHLSLERNMKCAIGQCGHCQLGPFFICKDGPVFPYDRIAPWLAVEEL